MTPWTAAHQAFLSLTISQSSPRFKCTESVMPSKRLILGHSLVLCFHSFPASGLFHGNDSLSELLCANHYSKPLSYFFAACHCSFPKPCLTSLCPRGLQHTRLPCPPPSPSVCSNSHALSQGCYLTIILCRAFSFCPQSFYSLNAHISP